MIVTQLRTTEPLYSSEETANMELVRSFLAARKPLAPEERDRLGGNFRLNRLGMLNLAELFGIDPTVRGEHPGYTSESFTDRRDEVVDLVAKGDRVWCVFRMLGHHTGEFWGRPPTNQALDLLEFAAFRLEAGNIVEAWFMNDELAICRQLGIPVLLEKPPNHA